MSLHIHYGKGNPPRLGEQRPDLTGAATPYALNLWNRSAQSWTLYVYQQMPAETSDVFSLAWFASPYPIRTGNKATFSWTIDYNFVWSDTQELRPGVTFAASGTQDCSPASDNTTEFDLRGGPGLSSPIVGTPAGSLVINDGSDVPSDEYSVGIGMGGTGTFAVQAGPNLKHLFTPKATYWVAAGTEVQIGTVLDIATITQTLQAQFPTNVYSLDYYLDGANTWQSGSGD